jgi:hypothetical protein
MRGGEEEKTETETETETHLIESTQLSEEASDVIDKCNVVRNNHKVDNVFFGCVGFKVGLLPVSEERRRYLDTFVLIPDKEM